MSYILNALKKAERDRKREELEDLEDFVGAGWDPYEATPKKRSGYKLSITIVAIAVLLFYGFYNLNNQKISDAELESQPQQAVEVLEPVAEQITQQPVAPQEDLEIEQPVLEAPVFEELKLPDVTIAGHIYIRSGSEKNRIFIGDRTYYVGDSIDSNWVIESINFDSLSIRSGNLSSEIPLR